MGALSEGWGEEVRDWVLGRGSCSPWGMGGPMVVGDGVEGCWCGRAGANEVGRKYEEVMMEVGVWGC